MFDTERDSFYVGALLHDIGKFIERAKRTDWADSAGELLQKSPSVSKNHAHRRYSSEFLRLICKSFSNADIERYVLMHHGGWEKDKDDYGIMKKDVPLKLIHIADVCASKEREKVPDLQSQFYAHAKLQSIFSDITFKGFNGQYSPPPIKYLDLKKLSLDKSALFPAGTEAAFKKQEYKPLVEEFENYFSKLTNPENDLLPILQKFLHAVPAQTPTKYKGLPDKPDINLFDHLRVTAAIALCLYDEWKDGFWNGRDDEILNDSSNGYKNPEFPAPCVLVSGDISGIQDFIFNTPSKGAAKTLKARSFFVQMLADVCVQKILDSLDMKPASLLYNGGGQFYFLVPHCKLLALESCRQVIAQQLIGEELFLSIASVDLKVSDFMQNFGTRWAEVNEKLSIEKLRKFKGLERDEVFGTFEHIPRKNDQKDRFFSITDVQFRRNNFYCIKKNAANIDKSSKEIKSWEDILKKLHYDFTFLEKESQESFVFNRTDFEGNTAGYRFFVKDLPCWRDDSIAQFKQDIFQCGRSIDDYQDDDENGEKRELKAGYIITYSQLAFKAYFETGTEKIGILKMDVDNLGRIFSHGFPDDIRTPSRMMALSRSLQWFFEGYMNTLLQKDGFKDYLYPVFSGGDDLFIVGAWHKVFDMALLIEKEFREFVCENTSVTLSASLLVLDEHYPVSRFAVMAEERLHEAKYESINKNSVNVFGQTLSWEELGKAEIIKKHLEELVDENGLYKVSRSIIYKVLSACEGLTLLHDRAKKLYQAKIAGDQKYLTNLREQAPVGEKVWRMSYMLRDIKSQDTGAVSIVKDIIDEYGQIIAKAMIGEPVNPMYVAVGARWAEMATRCNRKNIENQNHEDDAE